MARQTRPVIAIHEETGERRDFSGMYETGRVLGVGHVQVLMAIMTGQSVRGWRVYDTPDKIRERIKELEKQIKMLEG